MSDPTIASLANMGTAATGSTTALAGVGTTATNAVTQSFLSNALAQQGKPYVYGATAQIERSEPARVRLLRAHEVGRGPVR